MALVHPANHLFDQTQTSYCYPTHRTIYFDEQRVAFAAEAVVVAHDHRRQQADLMLAHGRAIAPVVGFATRASFLALTTRQFHTVKGQWATSSSFDHQGRG